MPIARVGWRRYARQESGGGRRISGGVCEKPTGDPTIDTPSISWISPRAVNLRIAQRVADSVDRARRDAAIQRPGDPISGRASSERGIQACDQVVTVVTRAGLVAKRSSAARPG